MNREDILEQINYKGKYTKDVKKRLNKLLKKYHPDNNKDDKKTILVLYDIKRELENGTLLYDKNKKDNKSNKDIFKEKSYFFFFESMVERLKNQREKINKKISAIYKKINFHHEKIDNKQDELTIVEFEINELEEELNELLKIDMIDIFLLIIIIIFILLAIGFKNIFIIFVDFVFISLELYYIYIRNNIYKEKKKRLIKYVRVLRNIKDEYDTLEDKIDVLEKEELKLKGERNRINNDLQYYNHQISKLYDKEYEKEYSKENKSYTKK